MSLRARSSESLPPCLCDRDVVVRMSGRRVGVGRWSRGRKWGGAAMTPENRLAGRQARHSTSTADAHAGPTDGQRGAEEGQPCALCLGGISPSHFNRRCCLDGDDRHCVADSHLTARAGHVLRPSLAFLRFFLAELPTTGSLAPQEGQDSSRGPQATQTHTRTRSLTHTRTHRPGHCEGFPASYHCPSHLVARSSPLRSETIHCSTKTILFKSRYPRTKASALRHSSVTNLDTSHHDPCSRRPR
ncbi:hypothetical protein BCV69DRAFT_47177 [Microstroma glucosiphilum]|uniref:Uncharacterized protein n=1 Tax=Pseudomicrostroma glucosiphilum TaxID=1684307 RepID=A0A316U1B7_9BASI|nr:hypothetical protein BCV69DRAFT_47177 [Pseudomicrostroma glucosiphilum]PWN19186.1 hypothetical protein BCV69DRAFT_47177 [Pseudomicrostroma glucosiphilum]